MTKEQIAFLSNGPYGVREKESGIWELYFHSDENEVVATCTEKYIRTIAMFMNGLIRYGQG